MAIDFQEKLGPLPVWAWGAIGGAVIIGGYLLINRGGSDGEGNVSFLDSKGYQTSGITGGSASIDSTPNIDNNTLWLSRATIQVAARLTKSPLEVNSALKKWLYGDTLTADEKGIVDTAIQTVGTPPEGTQGNSPVTPDKPAPAAPKPTYPAAPDYIVQSSSAGAKYLVSGGRIVKTYSKAEWGALRIRYGNNINIKTVSAAQIKQMGGK